VGPISNFVLERGVRDRFRTSPTEPVLATGAAMSPPSRPGPSRLFDGEARPDDPARLRVPLAVVDARRRLPSQPSFLPR
jgi:hypothetical protein